MVRPRDLEEAARIKCALRECVIYSELGGLDDDTVDVLIEQILESQRRNRYITHLRSVELSDAPKDPQSELFDPLRAAVLLQRDGEFDEAFWMVFLYAHFGKHRRSRFGYARDVYGRLGAEARWSWAVVSRNIDAFRQWLQDHEEVIRRRHKPGGFGNHRKYESLNGWSYAGTGAVVESYVDWIGPEGHETRFLTITNSSSEQCFDKLYRSMDTVHRFGRTARFDYLTTAYKVGLTECRPTHAHLRGATGPARGVKLLVTGRSDGILSPNEQDTVCASLEGCLQVGYDVLEDALCNWQKSPRRFKPFRG